MITQLFTTEEELNCPINIIVRPDRWGFDNENWGIQIDNTITPLYCSNCHTQLPAFYHLQGSRYGQVGTITCSCGAAIHCTDSDNIVHYLDTMTMVGRNAVGHHHIDFISLYQLNNEAFVRLKENCGFDLFLQYSNQTVELKTVLDELRTNYGFHSLLTTEHSADKITRLPGLVNQWLSIWDVVNGSSTTWK
jgi:hypothetical protein